ncbi:DpnI domain-containing protein [Scatolibacter rhodanostii]|uniref:DpnI domain-containing protein n=1 Tax=Scatolibacter rhodanostii TaxID=2014781 RepID=UPI000C070EA4|nr:DpnI domain-containing protein [Scatolibacter rhodanostii]
MYTQSAQEEVILIKRLLIGEKTACPQCGYSYLKHFHQKAKKSNTDYVCPSCNERYQVIKMIDELNQT